MTLAQLACRSRAPILLLYGAAIGLILLRAGDSASLIWWGGAVPFMFWIVSPIAFLCLTRQSSILLPITALVLAIGSTAIYLSDMFGSQARSTSALIFIFLPIYLWIAALIAWGLSIAEYQWRGMSDW